MIEVRYFNLNNFNHSLFAEYFQTLPSILKEEISRYNFFEDQVARLIGRILIRNAIIETGYEPQLLNTWERDLNNKPYIKDWMPFNISHSKDFVTIAFCKDEAIGIDVENTGVNLDTGTLSAYFCLAEQELIRSSIEPKLTFLDIWVKKEAVLKASGKGITTNTDLINCVGDVTNYEGKMWHLKKILIDPGYICYLAAITQDTTINIREVLIL